MRRAMAVVLLSSWVVNAGCARPIQAAPQLPTGDAAALLHDWRAVTRLHQGTHVLVTIDSMALADGRIQSVDDGHVTIARAGVASTYDRAAVVRIVKVDSMSAVHAKQGLAIGLVLDALLPLGGVTGKGLLILMPYEVGFFSGVGALSGIGESRQTLVYERQ